MSHGIADVGPGLGFAVLIDLCETNYDFSLLRAIGTLAAQQRVTHDSMDVDTGVNGKVPSKLIIQADFCEIELPQKWQD